MDARTRDFMQRLLQSIEFNNSPTVLVKPNVSQARDRVSFVVTTLDDPSILVSVSADYTLPPFPQDGEQVTVSERRIRTQVLPVAEAKEGVS